MTTFVLVHGAWHGGWVWRRVAPLLRAAGHDVLAPTLTGLSDRRHLLSPAVGLQTHVEDVVRLVEAETDPDDGPQVVLVGHSYAGLVVSGAADRLASRVRLRIYLDAFVGSDGESGIGLLPENVAGHYRESVAEQGFGWLIPPRSLEVLGVREPADLEWLSPRLSPHPWRTYTEPLRIGSTLDTVDAAFVECVDWMRVFAPYAQRAAAAGWPVRTIATGHEAMVTAPKHLATTLLDLVDGSGR